MPDRLRSKLTYANVMATLAVFIALGGGAYAVSVGKNSVKSKQIARDAVRSSEIKEGAVGPSEIREGAVGSGEIGEGQVGAGETAAALGLQCPANTVYVAGGCAEDAQRAPLSLFEAFQTCLAADRRLATVAELLDLVNRGFTVAGGPNSGVTAEWSLSPYIDDDGTSEDLKGITVLGNGFIVVSDAGSSFTNPYRCVAPPLG
jgi:hypothetical protein